MTATAPSLDRRPARVSSAIAVGASGVAVLLLGRASILAGVLGLLGLCFVGGGLYRGSHPVVSGGMAWFALGVLLASQAPLGLVSTGVVVILCVVTWDAAVRGLQIGRELTRAAETARVELLHSAMTATVGFGAFFAGYAAYLLVSETTSVLLVSTVTVCLLACVGALARG